MNAVSAHFRHAFSVAGVYALVGGLWIVFSDHLVASLSDDARLLTYLQTIKGWAFVGLSALLIAVLVCQAVRRETAALTALRQSEQRFRVFFDKASVGLAEVDLTGRWTLVNDRLCAQLGYSAAELSRLTSLAITHPDHCQAERQVMARMMTGETTACMHEMRYLKKDGTPVWVLLSANVVRDDVRGKAKFFILVIQEIEDRKRAEAGLQAALAEKEVLLAEIHHRVRNNLQLMVSLLSLEAAKFPDERVRDAFDNALARIEAMGLVHRQLYQNQNFADISFDLYVRELCQAVVTAIAPPTIGIRYELTPVRCSLGSAVPMGLALVELVINALKHAFPDGRPGIITIRLAVDGGRIHLAVADDGVGLPPVEMSEHTGLGIVRLLAGQLGGHFEACRRAGGGTVVRLDAALP